MENVPSSATIVTKLVSSTGHCDTCISLAVFMSFIEMGLDPKVWGPHYWFVLHTIALTYPLNPNEVTKKKYYDFVQNLPLFLPIEEVGNTFSGYLDNYPVTPYLDSRPSFVRWVHFMHNRVNKALGEDEMTLEESMSAYYAHYKPKVVVDVEQRRRREKIVFCTFVLFSVTILGYLRFK